MKSIYKVLLFSALYCLVSSQASATLDWPIRMNTHADRHGQMKDGHFFAIDITCSSKLSLQDFAKQFVEWKTRAHLILIAPNFPTSAPSNDVTKLPTDSLAIIPVFTAGKDKVEDHRDCAKSFIYPGGKPIYLVASQWASWKPAATVEALLTPVLNVLTPLFTFFTGVSLPAVIAGKITNLQTATSPLTSILSTFNQDDSYTKFIDNVQVGTYTIDTDYSRVKIVVRELPSIVLDANSAFHRDFRDQIQKAPQQIDNSKPDQSCRAVTGGMTEASFTSPTDVGYGLLTMAVKAGFARDDIIKCLTWDYAIPLTKMSDDLWLLFPTWSRFDETDVAGFLPNPRRPQPTYPIINSTLDDLVTALTQYATKKAPPSVASKLSDIFAPKVTLNDKTSRLLLGGDASLDPGAIADRMVQKGYSLFGCYNQTSTDQNDQGVDGATSEFLAFSASADGTPPTIDSGIVLRPLFDEKRHIATLVASQNRGWMLEALNARSFDCNGFTVKKPAS